MKILRNLFHKSSWPERPSSQREAARCSSTDYIRSHDYPLINWICGETFSKWLHKSSSEVPFLKWTCQTKQVFPLWNQYSSPSTPSVPHENGKWLFVDLASVSYIIHNWFIKKIYIYSGIFYQNIPFYFLNSKSL